MDKPLHQTVSVCPTCYKQIRANVIEENGAAMMVKRCAEHGEFRALVESDADFYRGTLQLPNNEVYRHQVIDITHRCNVACPNCYYPIKNKSDDRSIDSILEELAVTSCQAVLSGGEPTLRDDLPEIISRIKRMGRPVSILTNGIRFANEAFLDQCCEAGLLEGKQFHASISLHTRDYLTPKLFAAKERAIKNIEERGGQIAELMFTLQTLDELPQVIKTMRKYWQGAAFFRVRSPFNAWAEHRATVKIFVSDLFKAFAARAKEDNVEFRILPDFDNNVYHCTVVFDDLPTRLICCPDKGNIDVSQLHHRGPFHRSNNGELTNLLHSFVINEGMAEGWLNGKRIDGF